MQVKLVLFKAIRSFLAELTLLDVNYNGKQHTISENESWTIQGLTLEYRVRLVWLGEIGIISFSRGLIASWRELSIQTPTQTTPTIGTTERNAQMVRLENTTSIVQALITTPLTLWSCGVQDRELDMRIFILYR